MKQYTIGGLAGSANRGIGAAIGFALKAGIILCLLSCVLAALCVMGCRSQSDLQVGTDAQQSTPTTTEQDTATAGSQVNPDYDVHIYNGPCADGSVPGDNKTLSSQPAITGLSNIDGNAALASADGKYVQVIIIATPTQTGGTTPTVTGSSAGSATQTPSNTPTLTSTQHVDPRFSTAIPITVSAAPGSSAQGGSTSAALESSGISQSTEQQATIDYWQAIAKAKGEQLETALKALRDMQTPPAPSTQPTE